MLNRKQMFLKRKNAHESIVLAAEGSSLKGFGRLMHFMSLTQYSCDMSKLLIWPLGHKASWFSQDNVSCKLGADRVKLGSTETAAAW